MRFLVDESTGKRLAQLLSQEHDVVFVGDWFHSATDEQVLAFAQKQKRILITDDKDFGELVFRRQKPAFGVILLRVVSGSAQTRFQLLKQLLKRVQLRNKFVVLTETGIRIRKLQ